MARAINHASFAVFKGCLKSGLVGAGEKIKTMEWKKALHKFLSFFFFLYKLLLKELYSHILYSQAPRFISFPYIKVMTFHLKSVELSTSQCKRKWRGK